jgi:hypothetical protein
MDKKESNRTVFKLAGSFGPGGALVTLIEKICKAFFSEAYEQGDPAQRLSEAMVEKQTE